MQKRWAISGLFFPVLAVAEQETSATTLLSTWQWIWENIQSLDSLIALIVALSGGVLWLVFRFTGKKPDAVPINLMSAPPVPFSQLEQDYYAQLSTVCQRYDLGSFRDSQSSVEKARIQVSLSDVYVDLLAQEIKPEADESDVSDKLERQHLREAKFLLEHLQDQSLKRIVIRGDVGSGKTSFINYLCYSLIESRHGRELSPALPMHWQRRPVVRILLREMGGKISVASDSAQPLMEFVRQQVTAHIQANHDMDAVDTVSLQTLWNTFQTDFKRVGVLVLDGLDEVSNSHEQAEQHSRRQLLLTAIQDFAQNYPNIIMLITSRNHAYGGDDALSGFRLFQLEPLSVRQRYVDFIEHWYQHVAHTPEELASYQTDARQLLNNIAKRHSLQALTVTPLLLTLVLVLDKAKIGLPESRAELYQHAVMLLLERWNKQLLPYEDTLSLEDRQALAVLKLDPSILLESMKELAEHTYRAAQHQQTSSEQSIVFSIEAVEKALKTQLAQHSGLGFAHQDSCHNFLRFRSQILVAVGEGLSFVHKSFHEYLTAAYIMERSMSRERILREIVQSQEQRDGWREVFLFAMNIEKAEFMLWQMKQQVLSRPLSGLEDSALDNHLGIMSLFSEAALENSLEKVVSRDAKRNADLLAAYHDLQTYLREWWKSERLSIAQKARLGRVWGRCGDTRQGATFQRDSYVLRYHSQAQRSFPLPDLQWREISAGEFLMGSEGGQGYEAEEPAHKVIFTRPFYITASPITNAHYQAFVDAGGYEDDSLWQTLPLAAQAWRKGQVPELDLVESIENETMRDAYRNWLLKDRQRTQPYFWQNSRWNLANHPVVGVSWFEALAYAAWVNRHQRVLLPEALQAQGLTVRLPQEEEWEYAARGAQALPFAWGKEADPQLGNYTDTALEGASAVGLFASSSAFGLQDMSGNVWEWTNSRWGKTTTEPDFDYTQWEQQQLERNRLDPVEFRVVRGGSWVDNADVVSCAVRNWGPPSDRGNAIGFRLVLNSP